MGLINLQSLMQIATHQIVHTQHPLHLKQLVVPMILVTMHMVAQPPEQQADKQITYPNLASRVFTI